MSYHDPSGPSGLSSPCGPGAGSGSITYGKKLREVNKYLWRWYQSEIEDAILVWFLLLLDSKAISNIHKQQPNPHHASK